MNNQFETENKSNNNIKFNEFCDQLVNQRFNKYSHSPYSINNTSMLLESPKVFMNQINNHSYQNLNNNMNNSLNEDFKYLYDGEDLNFSIGQMFLSNKSKNNEITSNEIINTNKEEEILINKKIVKTKKKKLSSEKIELIKSKNTIFKCEEEEINTKVCKGLKMLSIKVKDIVSRAKNTTYKEVSETIINETDYTNMSNREKLREEQNIKRRVYDALNVLIASGILKKHDKEVSRNDFLKKSLRDENLNIINLENKIVL